MKAEKHAFYDEKRETLWRILPLDTPLAVGIDPSTVCNFRCKYCAQSLPDKFEEIDFKPEIMTMETFEKIVGQLAEFPRKIKKVHLECKGEPLVNPHIADMVSMLKEKDVTECVQIITNGSLLTHDLSDSLIEAGLDIICISLQGMTEKSYVDTCGVDIDMKSFVDNIRYFYEKSGGRCKLYVKNVDIALDEKTTLDFYDTYSGIADRVYVEHIANLFSTVDYEGIIIKDDHMNKWGEELFEAKVCSFSFFYLLIFPNGDIRLCTNIEAAGKFGNVYNDTLLEVWNGTKRKAFLKMHLSGNRKKNPVCAKCHRPYENMRPEDRLDGHEEYLLQRFGIE